MEIIWSPKANETFDEILSYIERKFTSKEVDRFVLKTYEVLSTIQTHPLIYPAGEKLPNIRRAVIHPHSTLFYRIQKDRIELVYFWDNRKKPNE